MTGSKKIYHYAFPFLVVSLLVAAVTWVYSFVDVFRLSYEPLREKQRLRRSEHLRQGILSFLRADYETAEREFLANARAEPGDPESLFRLAVISRMRGEFSRARRYLRALRRTAVDEKWSWERSREEQLIADLEVEKPEEVRQEAPARAPESVDTTASGAAGSA